MTRKEFIKVCGIFGFAIPFHTSISSCADDDTITPSFTGKVIIIGAGAGGLSSAYFLNQLGIDFEILEASNKYGGRMRIDTEFADFPIPLGAEWLHRDHGAFQEIVNDEAVQVNVDTVNYNPQEATYAEWENGELAVSELNDSDIKFVNSSWFNFFEDYIVPSVSGKITYNSIVQSIDYSGERVMINTQSGQFIADKVIVAVPLKILQDQDISFLPNLPAEKRTAINDSTIWEGFKAFIEFSEKFYHTQTGFIVSPETDGQKLYYDAAYGQNTSKHILGLFTIGRPAQDYMNRSGNELRDYILQELDEIYDNQATPSYVKHLSQNWDEEPFIKAGYLSDHADWRSVRELSTSVNDKIYFAGGAYTSGEDWVSVHTAAQSAKEAVAEIMA